MTVGVRNEPQHNAWLAAVPLGFAPAHPNLRHNNDKPALGSPMGFAALRAAPLILQRPLPSYQAPLALFLRACNDNVIILAQVHVCSAMQNKLMIFKS
jgi:hypothetical protein